MDMVFTCPNCKQQLEADTSMAGNEIECPSCAAPIVIPEATPASVRVNPVAASAAAKEDYHFKVPVREGPAEILIKKPNPTLEAAARNDGEKRIKVKCIRHTDCVEVGRDRFDEIASEALSKIGEANIVSITPITYSHVDLGSRQIMTDYGIMIIYRD